MATEIERVTALVEALKNDTATAQNLENLATLCIPERIPQIEEAGWDPQNLTNTQKARVILDVLGLFIRNKLVQLKREEVFIYNASAMRSAGAEFDEVNP